MRKLIPVLGAILLSVAVSAQGTWTQKANFGGGNRTRGVGVGVGSKGYAGCGLNGAGTDFKDWWEFDPIANTWTKKPDLPGAAREMALAMSLGGKAYVGMGNGYVDWYEYNPATSSWTTKASFPGTNRSWSCAFEIDNLGYVCGGVGGSSHLKDLWAYNPATNTWTKKADLPGPGRIGGTGFQINGKGYFGFGSVGNNYYADFYEYNPATNTWTQKASLPVGPRSLPVSFTLGNKGYLVAGHINLNYYRDIWEYDPVNDTWTQMAICPGRGRAAAVAFEINGKGYLALGDTTVPRSIYHSDVWEFNNGNCFTTSSMTVNTCDSFVSPSGKYTYFNTNTYYDTLMGSGGCDSIITIHLTVNIGHPTVGFFINTVYTSYVANSYQWYDCLTGMPIPGATGSSYAPTKNGVYQVRTQSQGCTDSSDCVEIVLGINQYDFESRIMVYPNPFNEYTTIELPSLLEDMSYTLYDSRGRIVREDKNLQTTVLRINRENLSAGIYHLRLNASDAPVAMIKLAISY